jgi:hypothetical protein
MAEHVSFFRARALPGKLQDTLDLMSRWPAEQGPAAKGWVRTYLAAANSDENDIMGVVVWDNTDNYVANANRPGQDAWYQQFRANLASDPEWFDGHLVKEWKA